MKILMCLMVAAAGWIAAAGVSPTVESWPEGGFTPGWTAERKGKTIRLIAPDGRQSGYLLLRGGDKRAFAAVRVAFADGALSIDATAPDARRLSSIGLFAPDRPAGACAGDVVTQRSAWDGGTGAKIRLWYEGFLAGGAHFAKGLTRELSGRARNLSLTVVTPPDLKTVHWRWDFHSFGSTPIRFRGLRWCVGADLLPEPAADGAAVPRRLFRASFDGTTAAEGTAGAVRPCAEKKCAFVAGVKGSALRATDGIRLDYPIDGCIRPDRGTILLWAKRNWQPGDFEKWVGRFLVTFPDPPARLGSGQLMLWFQSRYPRIDVSDMGGTYSRCNDIPDDDAWHHLACTWDGSKVALFVDGRRISAFAGSDSQSPHKYAVEHEGTGAFERDAFAFFSVGSKAGRNALEGLIDELEIWDAPLADETIVARAKEGPLPKARDARPDYSAFGSGTNPYVGDNELELLEEIRLDRTAPFGADRFRAVGPLRVGELGGVRYLEAGEKQGGRYALRLKLDAAAPLHVIEVDYPDDKVRTMDMIVQRGLQDAWDGTAGADYTLQMGVMAGDDFPNTGKIVTQRYVYWTRGADVALETMTAREGAPAAIAAVRVYRVKGGRLPPAVTAAQPRTNGWGRTFALYFEDPALAYDFSVRGDGYAPESLSDLIDRAAATMKFAGQDLLAYPGAWYAGLIGENGYNPRRHAPEFLSAWYAKFDREGLGLMPTINQNNYRCPRTDGLVLRTMCDGSLLDSPVAIHSTGFPNWGGWHNTPPNYCIAHPDVQREIEREIDVLVAQGVAHPSFKGVCFHLTRHCLLWWGDLESGYNDCAVEAFAQETGMKMPQFEGRLRARDRAAWLKANCRDRWVQWRCDVVTKFYARIAERLRRARPDLRLMLNSFVPPDGLHPDFTKPGFLRQANRECGLDGPALTRAIPGLILCQSVESADYRLLGPWYYLKPEFRAHRKVMDSLEGYYDLLKGAEFPWVNIHDRYWECPIGRESKGEDSLSCAWLKECPWRITTVNPLGAQTMRHYVLPLRFGDVLGLSKGGYHVGTYGQETWLVPFLRAWKALPPVPMADVGGDATVKVRRGAFDGKTYSYVVNTSHEPRTFAVALPKGSVDLVSGERIPDGTAELKLGPYELRSFAVEGKDK